MLPLQVILFACLTTLTTAYNILVVVPVPGKSHVLLFESLATELATRGHYVTYVAAFGSKNPHKNINVISIPQPADGGAFNFFEMRHLGALQTALVMTFVGSQLCNHTMQAPEFKKLINTREKFDVIVSEAFLTESVAAGLSYKLQTPLVGFGTFMPSHWVNHWVGNIAPTSFVPEPFTCLPPKMNIFQRTWNLLFTVLAKGWFHGWHIPNQDKLMRQYFGSDLPPISDILKNTSLMLVNDHFSLSFSRPAVANVISVGGLHVKPPKPLPQDLQKYLDDSKNGAVVLSLGSNLQSSLMSQEKIQVFLDTFAKLKENVIWKFEEDLPNKPKNVFTSKWLPQSDVLAHPNIKLFITHGGLLGTTEAMDRAVPLVGIPIFGDQPVNMMQSVNAGVGLSLDFDSLNVEELYKAIREVIDTPKYKQAAQARSKQLKDRETSAMDTAVYWIEYVVRHKGAPHLRSTSLDLLWGQEDQLDVIAILAMIILIVCYSIKLIIRKIWRKLTGSQNVKKKKTKQN